MRPRETAKPTQPEVVASAAKESGCRVVAKAADYGLIWMPQRCIACRSPDAESAAAGRTGERERLRQIIKELQRHA